MSSYQRALDYLYGFINFEQKSLDRYQSSKIDADRPRRLLAELGAPQEQFPAIHIAGTKGKGSVAAMCAASLRAAGLRVGLYTSPHLREFRERIRVLTPDDPDGRIPEEAFAALIEQVRPAVDRRPDITWFEIVTAVAFLHFAQSAVDVGVIEVGLGGRLDATNVLTPLVSVITSLSLDHTQLLGDTLAQIAYEKGGIIKPGVPVVTANQPPEALHELERITAERAAPLTVVGGDWRYEAIRERRDAQMSQRLIVHGAEPAFIPPGTAFTVALPGAHQLLNAAVALAALEKTRHRFPALDVAALTTGLATAQWDGRLQLVQHGPGRPALLVDGAHNEDSAARLAAALRSDYSYARLILIFGAPEDKNVAGMLDRLLPLADEIIVTTANHPRSATPEQLAAMAAARGRDARLTHSVAEALTTATALAGPADLIVATGSIILIGDLLNHWDTLQSGSTRYG
ncbi:FolC bifunctional protein [Candidatus Promineifilum breve]|uniref:tetrahydrofolate synthase n=1 Tax=Candidatus Promineifilum breve TaxID=1806508 RepID=A0A160T8R3_9CHLR|nr:folylpolyglutamate synthase/dihydrofolate synthase family protein [Candidatus Promineifilum breve]CUS05360.2 FolC bifunctional protein [Candidatus Promineifilum breve]